MENQVFWGYVLKKRGLIFLVAIFLAAASFLFLVVSEKAFKVRTDFLITQNSSNSQDFYALSRSAEYVGNVLSEAIYSERFIDEVVGTGQVPSSFLPSDKKSRLEAWSKMVRVRKNLSLGMVQVEVFGNDQRDTLKVSQALSDVLTQKNNLFRGGDEKSVEVRILSGPIIEKNPSITGIILSVVGGFLFGALISIVYIFFKIEVFSPSSKSTFLD